jgi:tRNA G37 N-methylase TrmD
MLRIDFVTIFPRMFAAFIAEGVIARGIKQRLIDVRVWDLRDIARPMTKRMAAGRAW